MVTSQLSTLILIAIGVFFLATRTKVISEHQRFAVYVFGKYKELKGPGLLVKFLQVEDWIKISIGDRLELIAPNMAKINTLAIPVEVDEKTPLNSMIRVTGFKDNTTILAILDSEQRRSIKCDQCGHEMKI